MRFNIDVIETGTASSAALGIGCRTGTRKTRHVALNQLWMQGKVTTGEIRLVKCKRYRNPADVLAKDLDANGLLNHTMMCAGDDKESTHDFLAPEA